MARRRAREASSSGFKGSGWDRERGVEFEMEEVDDAEHERLERVRRQEPCASIRETS